MCAQVLSMLGCVEAKRVLELGAGIGRFTGSLAATARSVLAVDFMANLIEENKRANSHRWAHLCICSGKASFLPSSSNPNSRAMLYEVGFHFMACPSLTTSRYGNYRSCKFWKC